MVQTGERIGTGVVIGNGSYVLTVDSLLMNSHTGISYKFVTIQHDDGSLSMGTVVQRDPQRDLAVLQLSGVANYPPADLSFEGLPSLGETVAIVGYSFETISFPTARLGIVNVRPGTNQEKYLETDALVGSGSGGSPLVSTQGEILGIIVNMIPLLLGDPLPNHAYALSMDDVRSTLQGWDILPG